MIMAMMAKSNAARSMKLVTGLAMIRVTTVGTAQTTTRETIMDSMEDVSSEMGQTMAQHTTRETIMDITDVDLPSTALMIERSMTSTMTTATMAES